MEFSNKPSECHETKDGKKIWNGRSIATVGQVVCSVNGELYVLLIKRGEGCPNEVGKWCLPCGYIDWDEDAVDAIRRETWEEAGVNIDKAIVDADKVLYNSSEVRQPWFVMHNPTKDELQNISLHFGWALRSSELPEINGPQGGEEDETEDIKWVTVEEAQSMEIGFNHLTRINNFLKYLITTRR